MRLLLLACIAFLAVILFLGLSSTARNGGDFTYPLDDSYIHLAVAKNLGSSGVWGINPDAFSAVSSSLSWPLLLTLFGAALSWGEWLPLLLNIVFGLWVLVIANRWMVEDQVGVLVRAAALAGYVFVVPLGVLAFIGLEHVLQIALALLLLRWATARLDGPDPAQLKRALLLAVLLVATRFEGLFLIAAIVLYLWRIRRLDMGVMLVMAGGFPLVVFGSASIVFGGRFLPTPLWMKGRLSSELLPALKSVGADPSGWVQVLGDFLVMAPLRSLAEVGVLAWMVLFALAWALWARPRGKRLTPLWIVLATIWLHLTFARTGWLGRYEAWLLAMLIVVLTPFAQQLWAGPVRKRWVLRIAVPLLLIGFAILPVRVRVASGLFQANRGSTNIYEQQIQMARFLGEYRSGEAVALNDIGVVGYYADVECVDLWGLSDVEVAGRRISGRLNAVEIGWLTSGRDVQVAAMYESVLKETGGAPVEWRAVADWTIHRNAVCGSPRVTWYATSSGAVPRLEAELREWSAQLPETVDVRWRGQ